MTLRRASRHAQLAARQPLFANFINIRAAGRSFEWSGNLFIQAGNLWRSYSGRGRVGCGYLRRVCQGTAKLGIPVGHPKRGIHRFQNIRARDAKFFGSKFRSHRPVSPLPKCQTG